MQGNGLLILTQRLDVVLHFYNSLLFFGGKQFSCLVKSYLKVKWWLYRNQYTITIYRIRQAAFCFYWHWWRALTVTQPWLNRHFSFHSYSTPLHIVEPNTGHFPTKPYSHPSVLPFSHPCLTIFPPLHDHFPTLHVVPWYAIFPPFPPLPNFLWRSGKGGKMVHHWR